jgi:hypothetical protein
MPPGRHLENLKKKGQVEYQPRAGASPAFDPWRISFVGLSNWAIAILLSPTETASGENAYLTCPLNKNVSLNKNVPA